MAAKQDWEQLSTRINAKLMREVRGVWAADMMAGGRISLRAVIERALRREVARAKRKKAGVVPVGKTK